MMTGDFDGLEYLTEAERLHLVLLDMTSPSTDGFELMERIGRISDAPVIIMSQHGRGSDIDRAFELGAADCVFRPFMPAELAARIRAAARRGLAPVFAQPSEPFVLRDLTIDYADRNVTVDGRKVQLTATE